CLPPAVRTDRRRGGHAGGDEGPVARPGAHGTPGDAAAPVGPGHLTALRGPGRPAEVRPVIQTQGLAYAYPGAEPLHLPDVAVPQGGTLVLPGPSGSGKSTWLALAAGLLSPTAGYVVVAGQAIAALGALARDAWRARHLGF